MDGSPYTMIAMFAVLGLAFYFLMIRPQKKRQAEQAKTMSALEPGARVLTSTGIFATIVEMGERQVVLETSPGNRLTVVKQALARAVTPEDEDPFETEGASSAAAVPVEEELPDSLDPVDDPDRRAAQDPSDPRIQAYEAPEFDPRPGATDESSAEPDPAAGEPSADSSGGDAPEAGSTDPSDDDSDPNDPPKPEDQ